jgi:hypothetical protein
MWMSQNFIGEYKYTTSINETFINSFDNKPLQIVFHDGVVILFFAFVVIVER